MCFGLCLLVSVLGFGVVVASFISLVRLLDFASVVLFSSVF